MRIQSALSVVALLSLIITAPAFAKKKKTKSVFVKKVEMSEVFDTYTYPAKVVPKVNALVLSESQGVVKKLHRRIGQRVKAKQRVVTIKHTDPVFKYRPMTLRAPVAGVISRVLVNEGSLVGKGEKLLMITDPDKSKILIEITAKDLGYIKMNMDGHLTIKGIDKKIQVKVLGISPFVDPATGTASAELEVKDKSSVPLGSLGKVSFKSNIHQGILLPESTLVYQGRKTYLRTINKENIVSKVEITTGPKRRDSVEILKGIKPGDIVVERSSGFLADGIKVEVKNLPKKKEKKSEKKTKNKVEKKTEKKTKA